MCTNMRQFAQLDPSWQITKGIAGEKAANRLVDPARMLGIQDQMDMRVDEQNYRKRLAANQQLVDSNAGFSSVKSLQPTTTVTQAAQKRNILGGFGG